MNRFQLIREPVLDEPWNLPLQVNSLHETGSDLISTIPHTFSHKPLDYNQPSIRLIHVHRDLSTTGLLQCTVFHTTVDVPYVCLSYMWGEEPPSRVVLMNERPLAIRKNLYDFLKMARIRRRSGQWFWIDALSIDQENTIERNHQVQQMGDIYGNATDVISWLGDHKGASSIPHLVSVAYKASKTIMEMRDPRVQQSYDPDLEAFFPDWERRNHDFLVDFFFNGYWSRAWATQEVVKARRWTILIGSATLASYDINLVHDFGQYLYGRLATEKFMRFQEYQSFIKQPLTSTLYRFWGKECQIPRDRVFSLLALCKEGADIIVDYSLSDTCLLYELLRVCKDAWCICSAWVIAQNLDLAAIARFDCALHSSFSYLDIDTIGRHNPGKGRIRILTNAMSQKIVDLSVCSVNPYPLWELEDKSDWTFDIEYTCDMFSTFIVYWEEPDDPTEEMIVWRLCNIYKGRSHYECQCADGNHPKPQPICTYGRGFSVFPKDEDKNIYTVRIALPIFVRLGAFSRELCSNGDGQCKWDSRIERPRLGRTGDVSCQ